MKKLNVFISIIILALLVTSSANSQTLRLLAGKYTDSSVKGIYFLDLNAEAGTFRLVAEADAGPDPSYFCISKKHKLIYAANEVMKFNGVTGGGVTTLSYNPKTGATVKKNEMAVPNGGPCFISLSPKEDFLFMANYMGGSVAVIKLDKSGIPVNVSDSVIYQKEGDQVSHAHMIKADPSGNFVYVTDLGLDRIVTYTLDRTTGKLNQIPNGITKVKKGSGPRHFVFSADGSKMYVICELNSTLIAFDVAKNGELKQIQSLSTLSDDFGGESFCAEIEFGKNGDYIYGTNRGENTIVTFKPGPDGKLTLAGRTKCGGNWPRNFAIDPSGKFLLVANQRSGNIASFKIDEKTGIPAAFGMDYRLTSPACVKFLK